MAPAAPVDTGLGMSIEEVTPRVSRNVPNGKGGAVVSDVEPLSDAYRSGMTPGDVILAINGREASSVDEVSKALKALTAGQVARLIVWRSSGTGSGSEQLVLLRKR